MASDADSRPEVLLKHRGFIAALAARLLADPNDAADVEQETWSVALQRPPRDPTPGWFWRVVRSLARNRVRGARRRAEREHIVARDEATPSTLDLLARLELERRVVDAVTQMAEPFRTVVLLRYYEDLPPREIAERLAIPIDTVHSRLKRGIERLRASLSQKHGTDWKAAFLPLLPTPVKAGALAVAGGALLTCGVITMSTTKLAVTLASLVVVGGAVWLVVDKGTSPNDRATSAASDGRAADGTGDPARANAPDPVSAQPQRSAEAAASPAESDAPLTAGATTGTFKVHALWSDATPAAGVLVQLSRSEEDDSAVRTRFTTNEHGDARFADLQPGKVFVQALRGLNEGASWADAQVEAGRECEATLKLGVGMNVTGIVVDGHAAPVADAEVVLCDWGGGEGWTLARSAADGTFRLRSVGTHTHIGARAPGFAPSPMRQFTASPGAETSLRVVLDEEGTELAGLVLGPDETPVANALVRVGDERQDMRSLSDGGTAMSARPQTERTDAQGRFTFRVLPIGKNALAVRANGLAPWHQSVELAAQKRNEITLRLERGVTLVGTVKDDQDAPVADASIEVGESEEIGHRRIASAADGSFRGEGLEVGALRVRASSDKSGKAETKLTAAAGETVRWDAKLTRGLEFRGRVLDDNDRPVEHAMIETRIEKANPGTDWHGWTSSDKDGRFVLKNCTPDLVFTLTIQRHASFPEMTVKHCAANGEERVIHLPKEAFTRIRGRIVDPDGNAIPNVHISPWMPDANSSPAETADATGAFDLGPYPPGELHLKLQAAGFPTIELGPRVLAADEVWEVGTLRFSRGGTLSITVDPGRVELPAQIYWSIFDAQGRNADNVVVVDRRGHSNTLVPGDYVLQVLGKGMLCEPFPFHIDENAETSLRVAIRTGTDVVVNVPLPEGEDARNGIPCVINDNTGKVVFRGYAWGNEVARAEAMLLPGKYTVSATCGQSHGESELIVPAEGSVQVSVVMTGK